MKVLNQETKDLWLESDFGQNTQSLKNSWPELRKERKTWTGNEDLTHKVLENLTSDLKDLKTLDLCWNQGRFVSRLELVERLRQIYLDSSQEKQAL